MFQFVNRLNNVPHYFPCRTKPSPGSLITFSGRVSLVILNLGISSAFVIHNPGSSIKQASYFTECSLLGFVCYFLMIRFRLCKPVCCRALLSAITPGPGHLDASWCLSASQWWYEPDHLAKWCPFSPRIVTICPLITDKQYVGRRFQTIQVSCSFSNLSHPTRFNIHVTILAKQS